ncbi:SDR family oxidoreductase [Streptomyces sp. FXJ1.4098]|nr:SDR family oxidoreductase [Streptomyces sp. FXJ1.4098]
MRGRLGHRPRTGARRGARRAPAPGRPGRAGTRRPPARTAAARSPPARARALPLPHRRDLSGGRRDRGIGQALSEDLASRHGANLVWLSRGELGPEQQETARRVREAGGRLLHLRADVADPAALREAVAETKQRFGALHGVFHAAMTFNTSTIAELTEPELRAAIAAKVDGSLALAAAVAGEPLDFLAFFSSVGSYVSAAGNAAYVAASTFQDAYGRLLATERPYPVRVINWATGAGPDPAPSPACSRYSRRPASPSSPYVKGSTPWSGCWPAPSYRSCPSARTGGPWRRWGCAGRRWPSGSADRPRPARAPTRWWPAMSG